MFTPYRDSGPRIVLLARLAASCALLGLVATVVALGFGAVEPSTILLGALLSLLGPAIALRLARRRRAAEAGLAVPSFVLESALLVLAGASLALSSPGLTAATCAASHASTLWRTLYATQGGRDRVLSLMGQPTKLLLVSFVCTIALGSLFLTFPRATTDGDGLTALDATFMATSATCVTGLAVVNSADDDKANPKFQSLTVFGQVVLLVLVQVGGLGIMTLSAAVVVALGGKLNARSHVALQSSVEEEHRHKMERSLGVILRLTFAIELVGALVLFSRLKPFIGDTGLALWQSVFTSISAFNNAGFALFSDNLMQFRGDVVVNLTVMTLIVLGGLGFSVVAVLASRATFRQPVETLWARWPLQVKVVVPFTLGLIFVGALLFYYFDFDHSLAGLDLDEKLLAASFQSVTFRTAGFNTVDLSQISRTTLVVSLILMYIGGSPGGTAGGVKTTTVALATFSVRSLLLGRDDVEFGDRTLARSLVTRSIAILLVFTAVYVLGVVGMFMAEPDKSLDALLFEAMSALATVGVSYGITPFCSTAGKIVLILLMFAGRVGPLSMALAVGEGDRGRAAVALPEGKLMVG